ncbi:unnamed protein product [Linum tenue]|uniref:Uncharacterized protein n=1 Tax=Linum tenue TaxID=586396 RepID=A0AAV0HKD7_9ROSI|nr:unnamed protein product [Linum tenue]
MDAKSLAKSKRAHSLHNSKKPHPSRKPKPSPGGGGGDGAAGSKAPGKPVKDKERATSSALPSNWDRYDEDLDVVSGEMSTETASKASDVVLPKSKGADYRHLLAEAQSQPHSSGYLDSSFTIDDVLPDEFKQTFGVMLSARGEGILSWILDDNFIVDEESGATASQEASFLSLNFQALEEQLARVDISKRLFIEPDILPADLCDDGSQASHNQGSSTQRSESVVSTSKPEHASHGDVSRTVEIVNQDADLLPEESTAHEGFRPIFSQGSQTSSPFERELAGETFNHLVSLESQSKFIHNSTPDSTKKLDTFEAAAAEAELDKLLDSFVDTNLDDPPSAPISGTSLPISTEEAAVLPRASRSVPYQSQMSPIDGNIDDMLDSLLAETSTALQQTTHRNQLPPDTGSSSSQAIPKSTALDDFGSWLDTI